MRRFVDHGVVCGVVYRRKVPMVLSFIDLAYVISWNFEEPLKSTRIRPILPCTASWCYHRISYCFPTAVLVLPSYRFIYLVPSRSPA